MNGILVVNKPPGMTSQQVVGFARRVLGIKKIGHTGTLDPDVSGVLPLCIGTATRVAEYLLDQSKAYRGEVTFGLSTTTQDASGEPIEERESVLLTEAEVREAMQSFVGTILQRPPAFSAIKIQGKRAYDLARQGEAVEIPPREVRIYRLDVLEMELDRSHPRVRFDVECSKGTYVRTLCHDFGVKLGVPAHMSHLVRTRSGPFTLEQALTLEQIEAAQAEGDLKDRLLPLQAALPHMPHAIVPDAILHRVENGREMTIRRRINGAEIGSLVRMENRSGQLLALYRVVDLTATETHTKPEKVFKE